MLSLSSAGRRDALNGVFGGAAAGVVLGTSLGRMPLAVGGAALLAASSLAVDLSGQKLKGSGMIDDDATPPRQIYPYPASPPSQQ